MHTHGQRPYSQRQSGSAWIEFVIVLPVLLFTGLATLQLALLWHARTVVDYAAFEAARTGATHHADPDAMKQELAYRLAPLYPKGDRLGDAAQSIALSAARSFLPLAAGGNRIRILNPSREAFSDWGLNSRDGHGTIIPNRPANHADPTRIGSHSGLSLADANVLRIEVTVPVKLKVPLMRNRLALALFSSTLGNVPPSSTTLLYQGYLPMRSVATVQMQSDAVLSPAVVSHPHSSGSGISGPAAQLSPPTASLAPAGSRPSSTPAPAGDSDAQTVAACGPGTVAVWVN